MNVLIAEDDPHTRDGLAEVLRSEGYVVVTAADGETALRAFETRRPDFVCLDIMMPHKSGYEVCRRIREAAPDVPIIFISAKAEEVDKLAGFELGADDFIEKPFGVREVVARIRAVTRRCYSRRPAPPESFRMGDLEVFPGELRARRGDSSIELSLRDVTLLRLRAGARSADDLPPSLGRAVLPQQPHARSAHLAAPQAGRGGREIAADHPHGARRGVSV